MARSHAPISRPSIEAPLLAFAPLNLRCNPFGELPFEDRIALAQAEPVPVAAGTVVQLIGPPGVGKTAHLLAQLRHRDDAVYWRADTGRDEPRPTQGQDLLLLDEADALGRRSLRSIIEPWPCVIAATHKDISFSTGRPTETVFIEPTNLSTLQSIVTSRIEWARLGPGPLPHPDDDLLEELWQRCKGNLRAVEEALYELFQAKKTHPTTRPTNR